MVNGMIDAMLFAEVDDSGDPLDDTYYYNDVSDEALQEITEECQDFLNLLQQEGIEWSKDIEPEELGADFYFTRAGHGTGFWSQNYPTAQALDTWAKTFGNIGLYGGDDGILYTHN